MSTPAVGNAGGRLASLDAYRGFVMMAMASGGLGLAEVANRFPDHQLWSILGGQVEHVAWRGCSFWDLIQPSFMFIVGVAMPFSYAVREEKGDSRAHQTYHALWRSLVLILLAVFLSSTSGPRTNWIFTNVLAQIGLGYPIVFLLLGRAPRWQFAAAVGILVAYWIFFAVHPLPDYSARAGRVPLPHPGEHLEGFLAHWSKFTNAAADFDAWFLNLFPRHDGKPYLYNEGGYATLNFVPSIATMLFGVLAGEWLRSNAGGGQKVQAMLIIGALALVAGTLMDTSICPVVKRIWTPSWAIFSTGWTCLLLALFYGVMDVWGFRRWAFPLTVVGLNSIAFYVMAQLMKPFVRKQLTIHVGNWPFDGPYGPIVSSASVLFVFWLIAYAMYRQRLFVRI